MDTDNGQEILSSLVSGDGGRQEGQQTDRDTFQPAPESPAGPPPPKAAPVFFNRELSWIAFNERVLEEGLRQDPAPLDRLKYLSIVSSNFDEFFMVRVAAIKRAREAGQAADLSGLTPERLLGEISRRARSIFSLQYGSLVNGVLPAFAQAGYGLLRPGDWSASQREYLESFFAREIYPLLTPLRLEDEGPLPSVENHSLYAAFLLEPENPDSGGNLAAAPADAFPQGRLFPLEEYISIIRIPQAPERIIRLSGTGAEGAGKNPAEKPAGETAEAPPPEEWRGGSWALLEDLVQTWGAYLYPGYRATESLIFKVNRDADVSVDEKRDEDFIEAMEEVLENRERSKPVRMVYSTGSVKIRDRLARRFSLEEEDLFEVGGPLNLGKLYDLFLAWGQDPLKGTPWKIYPHPAFSEDQPIWDSISAGDRILHLPYQSFDPVVRFFQDAAADPQVAAVKTTLYRTSGNSPIVKALEQASLSGKHVTAVVELKARFDEGRNISWANRLEKAGVIVVYGLARLKIHSKVTLVMRRERGRIKRYVHLSTGNYNDKTAKLYGDISFFTAREDIAYDAGLLFNMITGYSASQSTGKLVIAPTALKRRLLDLIAREINRSSPESPGRIMAKMNSLADPEIIRALYRASQAGVKISLNVRGICMLVPGAAGLSENIRVVSIIDRYLEHARIFYFANGGSGELYLSSADWMPRNLERRVELMVPVLQEDTRKEVMDILSACFQDNCQAWELDSGGAWNRITPAPGEKPFRAQAYFHSRAAHAGERHNPAASGEFTVRRSPAQR